jgi:hypothetical protein
MDDYRLIGNRDNWSRVGELRVHPYFTGEDSLASNKAGAFLP